MAIKYCTFWYPTIYQKDVSLLPNYIGQTRPVLSTEISDKDENSPYYLRIVVDDSGNLEVTSDLRGRFGSPVVFTVVLEKEKDDNYDGFVQYRFDTDQILVSANKYADFEEILRRDVYHLAKQFYHEHEINESKDCTLKGFISPQKVNLSEKDHVCLLDVFSRFYNAFDSYARQISSRKRENQEVEKIIEGIEKKIDSGNLNMKQLQEAWTRIEGLQETLKWNLREISRFCENALMEYIYYKNLYNSSCNGSFISDRNTNDANHRMALNIENSIQYIKAVQIQTQNAYNRMLHRKQTESKWLIQQIHRTEKRSGAVALLSIVLAIGLSSNDVWLKIFPNIPECSLDIGKQCFLFTGIIVVLLLFFVSKK